MIALPAAQLHPVCASPLWLAQLLLGQPYATPDELAGASDAILAKLEWGEILAALAAHPRIGDRAKGADTEAQWSRQEQSAAATQDERTQQALLDGNVAYEQRFDHVFLICASGRSAGEILAELTRRLANPPAEEEREVRRELAAIVRLRLAKALADSQP